MLHLEDILMSVVCAVIGGHVEVQDPCWGWKSSGSSWSLLLLVAMAKKRLLFDIGDFRLVTENMRHCRLLWQFLPIYPFTSHASPHKKKKTKSNPDRKLSKRVLRNCGNDGKMEFFTGEGFSFFKKTWEFDNAPIAYGQQKIDLIGFVVVLFCFVWLALWSGGTSVVRWTWEEWKTSVIGDLTWDSQTIHKNILLAQ